MLNILGPSGVGKGSIINRIINEFKDKIKFSVSHTTRGIRPGEVNGVSYYFITKEMFHDMIKKDKFIEWDNYNNNFYGTAKEEIELKSFNDSVLLLDINIKGAKRLHELNYNVEYIAIYPPKFNELKQRLSSRGTETADDIEKRLMISEREIKEIEELSFIKHKIINDDLDKCYAKVKEIMINNYPILKD